ncbi:protein kinase domain-containing protein [Tsukamurella pseudospumae]|uniref:Non-specific serine/threonine protein kinase n=1 Tax=Tsukamurella pseudospumae TaxID=239498 RepID=A0A137ZI45_9ACTN|nr:protein kinase [Tsukamurella pseudospumae]KXO97827.1 hypothetical protein AXK61_21685 [Tsukamurella pseudospumae]
MDAKVTLSIDEGPARGRYEYVERDTCFLGRKSGHALAIPDTAETRNISRTHCMFDISPPLASIRDFGSLNGTFVNGEKIGSRDKGQTPEEGAKLDLPVRELRDGDVVRVGPVELRVVVEGDRGRRTVASADAQIRDVLEEIDDGIVAGLPRRYAPMRLLGKGGQGVVLLARDTVEGRECAVKMMLPTVEVGEREEAYFLREVSALMSLDHPNIVKGIDSGVQDGRIFLVCEFCSDGSLHDLVARRGPLNPDVAVPLALDVLDALEYAHNRRVSVPAMGVAKGLVHRDVKPANILLANVDGARRAKLADFGLAKAFDFAGYSGLSFSNATIGTFVFMSRLQFENFKYAKPRVDVWATAATLYWALTGGDYVRDFESLEPHAIMKAILNTDPVPIRARAAEVPARLAEVIDEALIEGSDGRIATAAEFGAALRAAL